MATIEKIIHSTAVIVGVKKIGTYLRFFYHYLINETRGNKNLLALVLSLMTLEIVKTRQKSEENHKR